MLLFYNGLPDFMFANYKRRKKASNMLRNLCKSWRVPSYIEILIDKYFKRTPKADSTIHYFVGMHGYSYFCNNLVK
jgi:hypothetical protein